MVIDDTGSVEDIHAFIYCKKWRFGRVSRMPHSLTTLKDRATQLLIKYKSGALITQLLCRYKWLRALINISLPMSKGNNFLAMSGFKIYNIDQISPVRDSQSRNRVEGTAQKIISSL